MSDERYPIEEPEKSVGQLVGELTGELSTLISTHLELAKAELREDAKQVGRASAMLGAGAIGALLAIAMLSVALGWALAETMAPGWAFLVVGLLWAGVAGALVLAGRKRVAQIDRAVADSAHVIKQEIKEDQRWLTTPTN